MTQSEEILRILKKSDIFGNFDHDTAVEVAQYCDIVHYADKETIFNVGDLVDALYIIDEGQVIIERQNHQNKDMVSFQQIAQFTIGESFGEGALFTDSTRGAHAYAHGTTQVLVFPSKKTPIAHIIRESPVAFSAILRALIVRSSFRIRSINRLIGKNSKVVQELWQQLMIDKLMKIYNMTYLKNDLAKKFEHVSFTVSMIKPRNFKYINDTYGHTTGDMVLAAIGKTLMTTLYENNRGYPIRYLGNECALVITATSKHEAVKYTEEMVSVLQALDLSKIDSNMHFWLKMQYVLVAARKEDALVATLEKAHNKLIKVFTHEHTG